MKKIIAAFDGLKYSTSARDHATQLAKTLDGHLVGLFLDDLAYSSYNVYQLLVRKNVPEKKLLHYQQKDKDARDKAVADFSKACDKAAINYSIHRKNDTALRELLHETIFADLLVIDKHETFTHYTEEPPTRFIRDLLAETQCPVLLTSSTFTPPDKIIILYDGHPSSVYALKMLSYLFSSLGDLPVELLTRKPIDADLHVPENTLMKEFVKRHYPKATFKVFKGRFEDDIIRHLVGQTGNPLIVTGAYGRGIFSRWYHPSMADLLIQNLKFPLFIAHSRS